MSGLALCLNGTGDQIERFQVVGADFVRLELDAVGFFQERDQLNGGDRVENTARDEGGIGGSGNRGLHPGRKVSRIYPFTISITLLSLIL
jgi:hypothetical protein